MPCPQPTAGAANQSGVILTMPINNLLHLRRDHVTAAEHRVARAQTFQVWAEISSVAITI